MKAQAAWWKESLKYLLAFGLVFWLVRSGKLDLAGLRVGLRAWPELLIATVLVYLSLAVSAWRWSLLLKTQRIPMGFRECFSYNMIGLVFGLFTPGGAGGDLAKMYYVPRRGAAMSVLMDRLLGVFSLVLLVSIAAAWNYQIVARNSKLLALCAIAAGGAVAAACVLMAGGAHVAGWISGIAARFPVLAPLSSSADLLESYRWPASTLALAILIGVGGHLLVCAAFFAIFQGAGSAIPVAYLLLTVPFALLASAVPITPLGVGVGPAALFTMLAMVNGPASDGSNAFTLYQCIYIVVSLTGLIFYFRPKRRQQELVTA